MWSASANFREVGALGCLAQASYAMVEGQIARIMMIIFDDPNSREVATKAFPVPGLPERMNSGLFVWRLANLYTVNQSFASLAQLCL